MQGLALATNDLKLFRKAHKEEACQVSVAVTADDRIYCGDVEPQVADGSGLRAVMALDAGFLRCYVNSSHISNHWRQFEQLCTLTYVDASSVA